MNLNPLTDHQNHDESNGQTPKPSTPPTSLRQEVQAHTHWINDIALTNSNTALVSASSDLTVKVWRPNAQDVKTPQTIGVHTDYVKVLASPGPQADWVASGGLDRKISLWDLEGVGSKLQIAVGDDGTTAKGSVYALAATSTILASGGPESIVRVWDPRTGKRITKFVGHTDNIRDVLIAQDGETIMTSSSDQTVKVWSMTAGRCMYTLTMHHDSVWSLYSNHPRLSVFYSSDRSGMVAKTDCRGYAEMDEGLSIALCQEHNGVNKIVCAGDHVWTATSSSSINRWKDVDTTTGVQPPESTRPQRNSLVSTNSKAVNGPTQVNGAVEKQIPFKCVLRLSNTAPFPFFPQAADPDTRSIRNTSQDIGDMEHGSIQPYQSLPDHTIEGQNGLIKHHMLKDRRRVLTLDTAGDVTLWDLIQCVPIKSFGKCHLDDVIPMVDTLDAVAHWCTVDTRTGSLTCVLEENYCFDAEMYADELELEEKIEFREDQRVNLGKWILRYLFSNLIDEEIKRDEAFRHELLSDGKKNLQRAGAPTSIQLPTSGLQGWKDTTSGPTSTSTLRVGNGYFQAAPTPGLAIGLATPAAVPPLPTSQIVNTLPPTKEEDAPLEKTNSNNSQTRQPSSDRHGDYFSAVPHPAPATTPGGTTATKSESEEGNLTALPTSPSDPNGPGKEASSSGFKLGKRFNMSMPSFNMPKLKKTTTATSETATKAPAPEAPISSGASSTSSKTEDRTIEDNFFGCVQKIRLVYEDGVQTGQTTLTSAITPSLPNETPVIKPPSNIIVLIQEDRPDSGGVADLFEGTVGSLGLHTDVIEKTAPMWLGEVLLKVYDCYS